VKSLLIEEVDGEESSSVERNQSEGVALSQEGKRSERNVRVGKRKPYGSCYSLRKPIRGAARHLGVRRGGKVEGRHKEY